MSAESIQFCFEFLEIDSWDRSVGNQGQDMISVQVTDGRRGKTDTKNLGSFDHKTDESRQPTFGRSGSGMLSFQRSSLEPRAVGGFDAFNDQVHGICITIERELFASTKSMTVTIMWNLVGAVDEALGIDNIRITSCLGTTPSAAPSESPSRAPVPAPPPPPIRPPVRRPTPTNPVQSPQVRVPCSVCGARKRVSLPDAIWTPPIPPNAMSFRCQDLEDRGLLGLITPQRMRNYGSIDPI